MQDPNHGYLALPTGNRQRHQSEGRLDYSCLCHADCGSADCSREQGNGLSRTEYLGMMRQDLQREFYITDGTMKVSSCNFVDLDPCSSGRQVT